MLWWLQLNLHLSFRTWQTKPLPQTSQKVKGPRLHKPHRAAFSMLRSTRHFTRMILILNHHFTNQKTGSNPSNVLVAELRRGILSSSSALGTLLSTFSVSLLVNLFFINFFFFWLSSFLVYFFLSFIFFFCLNFLSVLRTKRTSKDEWILSSL